MSKPASKLKEIVTTKKAPVVQTDIAELGDKRLNVEEGIIKKREECLSSASQYRISGQDELEDVERSTGPRLQFTEVISRLKRELPQLRAIDGAPGNIALYYPRTDAEFKTAKEEWEPGKDTFFLYHKYVGGFPKEDLSEFSSVDIDSSFLPTRERRGWRSVLIALLKQGVMSYQQAVRQFGDAEGDSRGSRWTIQTRKWRANPLAKFSSIDLNQGDSQ